MNFVAVDKKKIFSVKDTILDDDPKYLLSGQFFDFEVPANRCVVVDNEYAIIMNLEGIRAAYNYAREKGYIKE